MGPELDLRPQLERLDRLMLRAEGLDPDALGFAFRPLWRLDAPARAALALSKAQATQVYAGLGLWRPEVMARLAEAQLVADATYPNAAALFAEAGTAPVGDAGYDPAQPRDPEGRWATTGGAQTSASAEVSTERHTPSDPTTPSGEPTTAPSAGPTAGEPDAEIRAAILLATPLLATLYLRQASRETLQEVLKHLPDWLTGGPFPDPSPSPLTMHGESGPSLPPDSLPASPSPGLPSSVITSLPGQAVAPSAAAVSPTAVLTRPTFIKPPQDAYDPKGSKAPGKPGPEKGFRDPKRGENWVPNPNGRGYGWEDDKGRVWVPSGQGGAAHGGPHWDVQSPGGDYENVRPIQDH